MRSRSERSRKIAVSSPSKGSKNADGNGSGHLGRSFGADEEERIFRRRMLFGVVVAVAGCTGAWFLLTTLAAGGESNRVLSARRLVRGSGALFTVKLLEFSRSDSKQAAAARLASQQSVKSLAGAHEFRILELPNGRLGLCVGRFETRDSPEMHQLLRRFQDYAERGSKVFPEVSIVSFPE